MSFWRWFKGDTRLIALERLDDTVKYALEQASHDSSIRPLLAQASAGMEHLLDTYHTDATTVARLENLIVRCKPEEEVEL